ncbi:unnamed protein product [Rotaria magnacalcarata]|uniref:Tc1-like transposase DDE domain-containing protein n=1 Tax=Rotaria magnacalcarata TaxID=392030 RepID=A0A820CN90_9BILA|nr:unnamed protein product [Rotaria magnacalcarata]CAF2092708.1 unnamed protein product [Rotaria magnacalcarata]CAF3782910.1 unnamed protein product [Rotaria magnacalcarata]CAF4218737.1 unnamed protein product [Rotaria magnacalcarata]
MKEIGALSSQTCQKWTDIFISGDFDQFCTNNRGGKRIENFYEGFLELELEAKLVAIERCRNKSADFTAWDLANFVDQKYYEITNTTKNKNTNFVRFIQLCRLDLRRWGFRFDSNSKGTYFEGHEHPKIVIHRERLALYPELDDNVEDVVYVKKTAIGSINIGYDPYFDNSTILAQSERLFKLLQFKSEFKNHNIAAIVNNATTHTAKPYVLSDFDKSIGVRCTTDTIENIDSQGRLQVIDCFFKSSPNNGLSEGLLEISRELNVKLPPKVKREQLIDILTNHPAFKVTSRLEQLANKYNVKIHFLPKFHCELNAIEGVWCYQKQFIRKNTNQTYNLMLKIIPQSRENFRTRYVDLKLFRRFWCTLHAYNEGQTYEQVLKSFFGNFCSAPVQSYRRITNTNL